MSNSPHYKKEVVEDSQSYLLQPLFLGYKRLLFSRFYLISHKFKA